MVFRLEKTMIPPPEKKKSATGSTFSEHQISLFGLIVSTLARVQGGLDLWLQRRGAHPVLLPRLQTLRKGRIVQAQDNLQHRGFVSSRVRPIMKITIKRPTKLMKGQNEKNGMELGNLVYICWLSTKMWDRPKKAILEWKGIFIAYGKVVKTRCSDLRTFTRE